MILEEFLSDNLMDEAGETGSAVFRLRREKRKVKTEVRVLCGEALEIVGVENFLP
jgi:hypothetical protein